MLFSQLQAIASMECFAFLCFYIQHIKLNLGGAPRSTAKEDNKASSGVQAVQQLVPPLPDALVPGSLLEKLILSIGLVLVEADVALATDEPGVGRVRLVRHVRDA